MLTCNVQLLYHRESMILGEGKSNLVVLSDSIKLQLRRATDTTVSLNQYYEKYIDTFSDWKKVTKRQKKTGQVNDNDLDHIKNSIPNDEAMSAAYLQVQLSHEILTLILTNCFALESYVNTLGYYLFKQKDILGLSSLESDKAFEVFYEAFEKFPTVKKWQTLAEVNDKKIDPSRPPFQNLKFLFNFRNDIVHGKVTKHSVNVSKRYGNKLPDPVGQMFVLSHGLFACNTYWDMVNKVHSLLDIPLTDFQGRYNLSPWNNEGFAKEAEMGAKKLDKYQAS